MRGAVNLGRRRRKGEFFEGIETWPFTQAAGESAEVFDPE